jgi:hypothetical protein
MMPLGLYLLIKRNANHQISKEQTNESDHGEDEGQLEEGQEEQPDEITVNQVF